MAEQGFTFTGKAVKEISKAVNRVNSDRYDRTRKRPTGIKSVVGGETYIGICKALNVGSNTINIIDGFSDNYATETSAGGLQINKFNFDLPANNFVITANTLIYIESILVGDPATSATAEIKSTTATTLTYEAGKEKTLISRVKFASGAISKHSQENVNPRIFVTNEC